MFKYLIVFILFLLMFGIYVLLIFLENRKIKRLFLKENEKINIYCSFIRIYHKVQLSQSKIETKRNVLLYLSQAEYIVKCYPFDVTKVEVCPISDVSDSEKSYFNNEQFIEEYKTLSSKNKQLVDLCSDTLERIFVLNHPIKHKVYSIKKNILLRILSNNKKKKIKSLKKTVFEEDLRNQGLCMNPKELASFASA